VVRYVCTAISAVRGQLLKTILDMHRASDTLPSKDTEIEELGFDVEKAADDFERVILASDRKAVGN